ncbi:hypothetical protein GGI35DRAFT_257174 [Trichoderma velutinum]
MHASQHPGNRYLLTHPPKINQASTRCQSLRSVSVSSQSSSDALQGLHSTLISLLLILVCRLSISLGQIRAVTPDSLYCYCHYHLFLTLIPPFFRHMQRPSRSNMINHYSSADNHATAGSTHNSRTSRANKFPAMRKSISPSSLSAPHPNTFRTPPCTKLLTCPSFPNTTLLLFPCLLHLIPVTFSFALSLCDCLS